MTAVEAHRPPGSAPGPRVPQQQPGPPSGRRSPHLRVAVAVVVLTTLLAGGVTFAGVFASIGRWQSTSEVVFNSTMPTDENIARGSRYVQDRLSTWETLGSSEAVARRAAEIGARPGNTPFDPATVSIASKHLTATEILEVTVTSDDAATVSALVARTSEYSSRPDSGVTGM